MANQPLVLFWSAKPSTTGFLSQWHISRFTEHGLDFNCAEQYMMYQKAILFQDKKTAQKILRAMEPKAQKRLGRKVQGFDDGVWQEKRIDIVKQGNRLKFQQNPSLLKKLCQTTGELVEASPYDAIWGIGMKASDPKLIDRSQWGLNLLGKILVELREDFKQCNKQQMS